VSDDEPSARVRQTLVRVLDEAAADARDLNAESVRAHLDAVETIAESRLRRGAGLERLGHGSSRVRETVDSQPLVAAEYLSAMRRLVETAEIGEESGDDGPPEY
jgi:hypothetical protein